MSETIPTLTTFTAGDIVISVVGGADAAQTGVNADNAASPITLEEIDPETGAIIGEMVLPQDSTTLANGTVENPISGEYGSSSEGSLELSGNGQSLVIAGYGVNATTFNEGGIPVYGTAALAQSTSVEGGEYTAVARVVADISYNGTIDTSTALYDVFNGQNPRSVATVNGTVFYLSGQGVKGSTNQGVFVAQDGASLATAIDTATDTRTVEIYDGSLYVSVDSTQGPTDGIESYGTLPSGAATFSLLAGMGKVTLTAAQVNSVNAADVGQVVNLSPENYFFANATTLYIADGGDPKEGGVGDGGLQKWTLNPTTGVWTLDYTLSDGLNLVNNSSASGTSGLIGLTATLNANGTVTFFATTEPLTDLGQTALVTITDVVANTIVPTGETFTVLDTAATDTNVRGVAEAPSAPTDIVIASGQTTSAGTDVTNGSTLAVQAGGTALAVVVSSGGQLYISAGGTDVSSLIVAGGTEIDAGNASGDLIYGSQAVSGTGALASNEIIEYGGAVTVAPGGTITQTTILTGGVLTLSGGGADNIVIEGGSVDITAAGASLVGSLVFSGAGEIVEMVANGTGGVGAVISGFGGSDAIDMTFIGAGAMLASSVSGGNTDITVTSGGVTEQFVFSGQYEPASFELVPDGGAGTALVISAATLTGAETVSAGFVAADVAVSTGGKVTVSAGGSLISASVAAGGSATVSGIDTGSVIQGGGTEYVFGFATGDTISGTQVVSSSGALIGSVASEIVANGGTLDLFIKGASASNVFVESGGALFISGNADVVNAVLSGGTIVAESGKAELTGSLVFDGAGTIVYDSYVSATGSSGDQAVISGFGLGDVISLTVGAIGTGATLLASSTAGGNTIETISGTGGEEFFTFAGTGYAANYFELLSGPSGAILAVSGYTPPGANTTTITSGNSAPSDYVVDGGYTLDVLAGGTAAGVTVLAGGTANFAGIDSNLVESAGGTVNVTGIETTATILNGGTETMNGTATGDLIFGVQMVTLGTAILTSETVFNGGAIDLFIKGAVANDTTIETGGAMYISGNATAANTYLDGGTLVLESPKVVLDGGIEFQGAGLIDQTDVGSGGYGLLGSISGFGIGDTIILDGLAAYVDPGIGLVVSGGTIDTTIAFTGDLGAGDFNITNNGSFTTITGALDIVEAGQTVSSPTLSGETYVFESGATVTGNISFSGTGNTLELIDDAAQTDAFDANTIENFAPGDTIDLGALSYVNGSMSADYDSMTGLLTISNGTVVETLQLGNFATSLAADFVLTQDAGTGTDITLPETFGGGSALQTVSAGVDLQVSAGQTITSPTVAGTLDLAAGASISGSIDLTGGGVLVIEGGTAVPNEIFGFAPGETIELAGIAYNSADYVTIGSANELTIVTEGDGNFTFNVNGVFVGETGFSLNGDLGLTTNDVTCFAAGTRILTAGGRLVPVEALAAGDRIELYDGTAAPITWIGRRAIEPDRHPRPASVRPVLIEAGALGNGLPWRDLLVSPDHALYLAGHLIPAKTLLNGFTVRQAPLPRVTYYHIELPAHGVLFAEGVPAESYLDTGNRACFETGGGAMSLHPEFAQARREQTGCAPFAEAGPAVESVRAKMLERAGIETSDDPDLRIRMERGRAVIESRSAIPGEISADPRDRRRLGVKIAALTIGGEMIALDHPALTEGWHDLEPDGRWTDGKAVIPESLLRASAKIDIRVAATLRYPVRIDRARVRQG
jgi:autotransporter passenger strand-loop-strand repeat protein